MASRSGRTGRRARSRSAPRSRVARSSRGSRAAWSAEPQASARPVRESSPAIDCSRRSTGVPNQTEPAVASSEKLEPDVPGTEGGEEHDERRQGRRRGRMCARASEAGHQHRRGHERGADDGRTRPGEKDVAATVVAAMAMIHRPPGRVTLGQDGGGNQGRDDRVFQPEIATTWVSPAVANAAVRSPGSRAPTPSRIPAPRAASGSGTRSFRPPSSVERRPARMAVGPLASATTSAASARRGSGDPLPRQELAMGEAVEVLGELDPRGHEHAIAGSGIDPRGIHRATGRRGRGRSHLSRSTGRRARAAGGPRAVAGRRAPCPALRDRRRRRGSRPRSDSRPPDPRPGCTTTRAEGHDGGLDEEQRRTWNASPIPREGDPAQDRHQKERDSVAVGCRPRRRARTAGRTGELADIAQPAVATSMSSRLAVVAALGRILERCEGAFLARGNDLLDRDGTDPRERFQAPQAWPCSGRRAQSCSPCQHFHRPMQARSMAGPALRITDCGRTARRR